MGFLERLNMRKSKIMIMIILQICLQALPLPAQVSLRQTAQLDYSKTDDLSDISASLKVQEFQNLSSASPYELKPSFNVSFMKDWEDDADQSLFLETNVNFMYDQFDKGSNCTK